MDFKRRRGEGPLSCGELEGETETVTAGEDDADKTDVLEELTISVVEGVEPVPLAFMDIQGLEWMGGKRWLRLRLRIQVGRDKECFRLVRYEIEWPPLPQPFSQ